MTIAIGQSGIGAEEIAAIARENRGRMNLGKQSIRGYRRPFRLQHRTR